jgi:hypothetical protein
MAPIVCRQPRTRENQGARRGREYQEIAPPTSIGAEKRGRSPSFKNIVEVGFVLWFLPYNFSSRRASASQQREGDANDKAEVFNNESRTRIPRFVDYSVFGKKNITRID